jgi:plasmid stability protein
MKPITIRNLPPEVAHAIRQRAKARNTSLNRTVIDLLEEQVLGSKNSTLGERYHELAAQRQIDPGLWK